MNEKVDKAAKESLSDRYVIRLPLNVNQFSTIIKSKVKSAWQREWNRSGCEYHSLKLNQSLGIGNLLTERVEGRK